MAKALEDPAPAPIISSALNNVTGPSSSHVDTMLYTPEENAQHSENVKWRLKGASATGRQFYFLNVDLSSHEGDVGTNFIIVDMRVLNILLLNAKCSECKLLTLKPGKQEKEYGLAVKLVLVREGAM